MGGNMTLRLLKRGHRVIAFDLSQAAVQAHAAQGAVGAAGWEDFVKKFKDKNVDPEGYTLYTYAALQIWTQAVAKAKTTDAKKVAETIKGNKWDTVLGPISYDKKGDITTVNYVFYRWSKDGKYDEIPSGKGS